MKQTAFSLKHRARSFGHAFNGLTYMLRNEHNAWIHATATAAVVVAGLLKGLTTTQWLVLWLAIAAVWAAELFNTCIEVLCDLYCDHKFHPQVKIIKDLSAGAVLVAAFASVITGFLVFTS